MWNRCELGPVSGSVRRRGWMPRHIGASATLICVLVCGACSSQEVANPAPAPASDSNSNSNSKSVPVAGKTIADDKNTPADKTVTLTWMGHWKDEDKREDLVREFAKDFEFRQPGVKVELVFAADIIGYKSHNDTGKFIVDMIRSDNIEWDIIWLDHIIYTEIATVLNDPAWGKKHLVDFAQYPDFVAAHKDYITANPIYRANFGGIFVGPYLEGFVSALYYNRDVAERVGVAVPATGMTYNQFRDALEKLHQYNRAHGTDIRGFLDAHDRPMLRFLFDRLVKCELADIEEVRELKASAEKLAALRKALNAFEELSQYRPVSAAHVAQKWRDTRHLLLDDELLFHPDGTWMYSHWRPMDEGRLDKIVPAESVAFAAGCNHYNGGYIPTWAVLQNAPNRDLAAEFLRAMATPQQAEKWVRYAKNPTGLKGHLSEPTFGGDAFERFQAEITARYQDRLDFTNLASVVLGENNAGQQRQLEVLTREVILGQKTATQAYDELLAGATWTDDNPRPED